MSTGLKATVPNPKTTEGAAGVIVIAAIVALCILGKGLPQLR